MRTIASKIYTRKRLKNILLSTQRAGKKIGLTNGTFDILHAGHALYLEAAKKKCDILVVSVNTDTSVRKYKDPDRPINSQIDRANVIASLESVDYVTFHKEPKMRTTLTLLRPDYYIKGGDYQEDKLTSKDILEEWGGKVIIIPFVEGKSTSAIIQKIGSLYVDQPLPITLLREKNTKRAKAVILDRDGVINEEVEYLHEPEKFQFIEGVLDGLTKIRNMGFEIVIVTTQAGIGLGYFTQEDFFTVNKVMLRGFHEHGIVISKIYFCPHSVSEKCTCRKPEIRLIKRAQKDLNLDLSKSWVIGDKTVDIETGRRAGCHTVLVRSGYGGKDREFSVEPDFIVDNLVEAAEAIKRK